MKLALPLLLAAFVLTACNTHATRRDLYAPTKANGPYSQALRDQTWYRGVKDTRPKKSTVKPGAPTTPAPTGLPGPA